MEQIRGWFIFRWSRPNKTQPWYPDRFVGGDPLGIPKTRADAIEDLERSAQTHAQAVVEDDFEKHFVTPPVVPGSREHRFGLLPVLIPVLYPEEEENGG